MLKLLKYEWKACARICLPLYGAMLLMSVVSAVMTTERAQDFMNGIPTAILECCTLPCWLRCLS